MKNEENNAPEEASRAKEWKEAEGETTAATKTTTTTTTTATIPDLVSKLNPDNVLRAVNGLLKVVEEAQKKTSSLIEENTQIQLQYVFKKIPQLKNKRIHVKVPHSLITEDTDVCLFVKDVHKGAEDQEDKRDFQPSVRHFRKIVDEAGVKVEEIIPMIQLKREFHDFETQRKLCDSFDVFLCDDRISKFMPRLLGKNFFKKRRLPVNVKLSDGSKTAANSLVKALSSVHGVVSGQGASTSLTVAHTGLTPQQIAENICAVVQHLVTVLPPGWTNIRSLNITTTKTTSIPLFVSTEPASAVILPPDVIQKKRLIASGDPGLIGGDGEDEEAEEGIVEVFDDGSIRIKGEDDDEEEEEEEEERGGSPRKRQKKSGESEAKLGLNGKKDAVKIDGKKDSQKKSKNKKKSAAVKDGNDQSSAQKKGKMASTKGPLSKKPRLA